MFIILLFVVGLLYYVYQCYQMRNLPPYYKGALPIIGHSFEALASKNYYNTLKSVFQDIMMERGAKLTMIRLGIRDFYVISSPDDAYLVANICLKKENIIYNFMKFFFGEGLLTADVAKWKIHRKLLNPSFNQRILDGYLSEINNQTRQLVDTVAVNAGKGDFDHYNNTAQTILNTVFAISLGTSVDEEDVHIRQMFIKTLEGSKICVSERIAKFWLQSDFIHKITGHKKHQDLLVEEKNFLLHAILKKKKTEFILNKKRIFGTLSSETRFKPFLELLLELAENEKFTDQEISDELINFIGAGTDTMTVTLSNALTCIGTYGAIQDRIFAELEEVFEGSDRDVDKQDLPRLKYLEAVIKETLRLYPPIIIIGRASEKEIKIKDYTLPAGSRFLISIYGILRHWTWGPDAETFKPERWLDGSLPKDMKAFVAFSTGKRNCIGANFAIMCIKTMLAGFLRRYSIKSDVTKMVQEFYVTSKPISGHEISIEDRRQLGNPSGEL